MMFLFFRVFLVQFMDSFRSSRPDDTSRFRANLQGILRGVHMNARRVFPDGRVFFRIAGVFQKSALPGRETGRVP
jgi:hypothetical protein